MIFLTALIIIELNTHTQGHIHGHTYGLRIAHCRTEHRSLYTPRVERRRHQHEENHASALNTDTVSFPDIFRTPVLPTPDYICPLIIGFPFVFFSFLKKCFYQFERERGEDTEREILI